MNRPSDRPAREAPPELVDLLQRVRASMRAEELWLFGSRARLDNRPDSDWDLVAVLPDDAPEDMLDPMLGWTLARGHPVPVTLLSARKSELEAVWGLPNTLGYDLSRDGVRLLVG